jgi:YaiO family outer membrane protein
LAAACLAVPAAAQPGQDDFARGVAARTAGDSQGAIEALSRAVAADPANADAQLQLGLALLGAGRLDQAEAAFRRTLELAPQYADARIGLARVAQRRGDSAAAIAALAPVPAGNIEAEALRGQLRAVQATRWQADLDLSYSDLEGGRPSWREGSLRVGYRTDGGTTVSGSVEVSERFNRTDLYGEARVDQRLSEAASLYVALGATPNADFRPAWQLSAGGALRVRDASNPTLLTLDARQARFRAGSIQTLNPGIEQYLEGGKAWLTARWINIFDENGRHSQGWLARGDLMATDRLRLFAGAADAPDTSEGVVIDTFSAFGGAAYQLRGGTTLRVSLAHEDRETGGDRLQLGVGLGIGF